MDTLLNVAHVLLAAGMIVLILVQRGAGASAGASFGAGASNTVFGSQGAASFLTRSTAFTATGFFLVSFVLAILAGHNATPGQEDGLGVMDSIQTMTDLPEPVSDLPANVVPADENTQAVPEMPQEAMSNQGDDIPVVPESAEPTVSDDSGKTP